MKNNTNKRGCRRHNKTRKLKRRVCKGGAPYACSKEGYDKAGCEEALYDEYARFVNEQIINPCNEFLTLYKNSPSNFKKHLPEFVKTQSKSCESALIELKKDNPTISTFLKSKYGDVKIDEIYAEMNIILSTKSKYVDDKYRNSLKKTLDTLFKPKGFKHKGGAKYSSRKTGGTYSEYLFSKVVIPGVKYFGCVAGTTLYLTTGASFNPVGIAFIAGTAGSGFAAIALGCLVISAIACSLPDKPQSNEQPMSLTNTTTPENKERIIRPEEELPKLSPNEIEVFKYYVENFNKNSAYSYTDDYTEKHRGSDKYYTTKDKLTYLGIFKSYVESGHHNNWLAILTFDKCGKENKMELTESNFDRRFLQVVPVKNCNE